MAFSSISFHVVRIGNGATTSFPFAFTIKAAAVRRARKTARVRQ